MNEIIRLNLLEDFTRFHLSSASEKLIFRCAGKSRDKYRKKFISKRLRTRHSATQVF